MGCKITDYFNKYFIKKIKLKVILYRDASEIILENLDSLKKTKKFLNCIKNKNIKYVDTFEILKKNNNKIQKLYIKDTFGHPTKYSNNLISQLIASNLE